MAVAVAQRGGAHVRSFVIVATALGFVLVQLDVSIVNVALATIGVDLHSSVAGLQWVVDAYTVAFAALLLSAGSLGDRIGARRTFVAGFALFVCASVACGFAGNASLLIAARLVQGIGAALLVPCSLSLLNHACGDDALARAKAIGLWTASGSVALAAGPVIGGLLVHGAGWRSIFFVNVPLGIIGIWLTMARVEETKPRASAIDVPGQVLAVLGLATVTGAVITAGADGWLAPNVLALFGLFAGFAIAFVLVERNTPQPMLPLDLFSHRIFSTASLVGFTVNLTVYGAIFIISLYMQRLHGYSPIQTGLAFLPFCVALGAANILAAPIAKARGSRFTMVVGLAIAAIGYAFLLPLTAGTAYVLMLPGLILMPIGIGLVVPAMTTAILSSVEKERSGLASGVLNTIRQSGGAIGVALFGSFLAAHQLAGVHISFAVSAALCLATLFIAFIGLRKTGKSRPQPKCET